MHLGKAGRWRRYEAPHSEVTGSESSPDAARLGLQLLDPALGSGELERLVGARVLDLTGHARIGRQRRLGGEP